MSYGAEKSRLFNRRDVLKLWGTAAATSTIPADISHVTDDPSRKVDAVVVGAGFAGLMAARTLKRAGKKVAILEARERVGGRVKAGSIAGQSVDVGGMWVGPSQTRLLETIKEYGLELVPQYLKGKNILEAVRKRYEADGEELGWQEETKRELDRVLRVLTKLSDQLPLNTPWAMPHAEEYDTMTADDWLQSVTNNKEVLEYIRAWIRGVFTADPYQISFLFFLFYMRSGDNFEMLSAFENGAQAWRVKSTMHSVAARIAAELSDTLVTNAPVRAIFQDANGVLVKSDKGNWRADYSIVAVPLPLSVRIQYEPPLPPERDLLAQHMAMGSVIKYWVAYEKPFWRERGLSGMIYSDEFPSNFISVDGTPLTGKPGLLVGFMEARNALLMTGKTQEERKKIVVERLVKFLGPEAAHPLDYEDQNWSAEQWSRGCYVASMAPGIMTTLGKVIREPFGRIHWAGTETSERWMGYIDGAIRSGDRAAEEVLKRL